MYFTLNVLCHQGLVPLRVARTLEKHKRVTDLRQLVDYTEQDLLVVPKIGVKSVKLIKRLMEERGLALKPE